MCFNSVEWRVEVQQNNQTIRVPETLDVSRRDAPIFEMYTDLVVNRTLYWIIAESPSGFFKIENATGVLCKSTVTV